MNIKELAEQAGLTALLGHNWLYGEELTRFAELVRLDETKACAKHYLEIMRDAVEAARLEERESCAKLCEGRLQEGLNFAGCAAAIRARG